ncbi:MAG: YraN family protein [Oscillospiraceae bacterium]|nr:YraN family protein [Oscillospiraceae bacterium]MBQ6403246.1 YraN family protein [Oscillospiraceae bacterium]
MAIHSDQIKSTGKWGEAQAEKFLRKQGYRTVERNWSCRFGEIDLIVSDREYLVFVEVKTRKSAEFAEAREFVGTGKQRRVRAAASLWLASHETDLQPRFDVIEIYGTEDMPYRKLQIRQIENAFE